MRNIHTYTPEPQLPKENTADSQATPFTKPSRSVQRAVRGCLCQENRDTKSQARLRDPQASWVPPGSNAGQATESLRHPKSFWEQALRGWETAPLQAGVMATACHHSAMTLELY